MLRLGKKKRALYCPLHFRLLYSNRIGGFPSSRSAFNRFAHGNRKLPCSTLSGVKCHPSTRCRRQRAFDSPDTAQQRGSERRNVPPHRAGITTLPGQESAADWNGKALLIRPGSRPRSERRSAAPHLGIRNGSAVRDGKAATQIGTARKPNPRKRKTLRTPRQPEHLPQPSPQTLTRPRIARPAPPRNASNGYSADLGRPFFGWRSRPCLSFGRVFWSPFMQSRA